MIQPGSSIELSYPDSTLVESLTKLVLRRVHVYRIRDLVADPLTPEEFLRRPFIRRSRWLVSGFDLDRQCHRKFYLGNSVEHRAAGLLRIALYEPGAKRPTHLFPRPFGPTRSERRHLIDSLNRCLDKDLADLRLRVFSDDLRLHQMPTRPTLQVARRIRFAG